jgi:hypothetical protein
MRHLVRRLVITAVATATLVGFAGPAHAAYTVRALWNMDKLPTMVDAAGGDNNGTTYNVTLAGKAYSFNGTSSYATAPDHDNLDPGTANVRLTAKINITTVPAVGQTYDIVRKGTKDTVGGYYKLEITRSASGQAVAACRFKGSTSVGSADVVGTASLAGTGLQTIVCTKSPTGVTLRAGGLASKVTKRLGPISNAAPIHIGAKGDGTDWFNGLIDLVKIEIG